ncbi:MAG: molybdopterin-dependent oxidoreductase [Candidatus Marinimicrobia bacterium]|jgi:putative selenate reductase molybdopterin-binding subunit|nr:molybdopterin-dependent oxidoreductase [Candidatus Neomarinimicrobiota bacterium]MBT3633741.1 molybdopterin-dependent oxidoreductase [Candidatus Neomarinimicrobiota bacterium]MBT3682533.1 molybdopterin-dependent oxidoreductase [Candidatus Neomarinimicrobiota bacterium]MBT3759297.1 molybdopterin-dependent oxidoreductase [Candidatus Neomarinimicrobiota bacterium]MBT3894695.1 molybdopterin-dependent oxidoreductase [Candidatus Neomarinimicrobiota bacterium]
MKVVGKKTQRVDGKALASGKPVFADDIPKKDFLYLKLLYSPIAHGKIKNIDISKALALEGVAAVLTHKDFKPHYYTTAGQGYPEPSPRDTMIFNPVVRFVGDKVAVIAAESIEIAKKALELIEVDYTEYPAIFDPEKSKDNEVVLHPEIKNDPFLFDAQRNLASRITAEYGDPENAFDSSKYVFEGEYSTPYAQQAHIEPHITLTWLDEHERLIIRTATQVPFHVRRIVGEVLDFPISRIRVIKPRIGGGFGSKQEILNEEICAAVTLKTGRPSRIELTRKEEFFAARSRHPQKVRIKMGFDEKLKITAIDLNILENSGAYGSHALTVMSVTSQKVLSLYKAPNFRVHADAVYTNLPIAGAYRGYGAPQGFFALECLMDEIAIKLQVDPFELRIKNFFKEGDEIPIASILGEGREGFKMILHTTGIKECLHRGKELMGWDDEKKRLNQGEIKQGVGLAAVCQGSGIPGIDMAAAFIKMNEDASFNLMVGAADIGTGSDTALAQIAAEVLEVSVDKIIVYSSDTDLTPFDTGAYASSTVFVSGGAVKKAAEKLRLQILDQGQKLLDDPNAILEKGKVTTGKKSLSYEEICTKSFYTEFQMQPMATASHLSYDSPPPFNATFADVSVDTETGIVTVNKIVSVSDCGQIINPKMAEGQAEGAIPQSIGMALSEYMIFDKKGRAINTDFDSYHIYTAIDMPEIVAEFVHTSDPTGPFGAKAVAEIPINGPAPAIANAIYNACGVRIRELPITPEKILRGLGKI